MFASPSPGHKRHGQLWYGVYEHYGNLILWGGNGPAESLRRATLARPEARRARTRQRARAMAPRRTTARASATLVFRPPTVLPRVRRARPGLMPVLGRDDVLRPGHRADRRLVRLRRRGRAIHTRSCPDENELFLSGCGTSLATLPTSTAMARPISPLIAPGRDHPFDSRAVTSRRNVTIPGEVYIHDATHGLGALGGQRATRAGGLS